MWKFLLTRSVWGGGLFGLLTTAASIGLSVAGVPVPAELVGVAATVVGTVASGFIPDSVKEIAKQVDAKVIEVSKLLPK